MITITLCAGVGSRLKPLTNKVPKCLVAFDGKPILDYQIDVFQKKEISKNYVVTGYLDHAIKTPFKKFHNINYEKTNMVYSLALARELFDGKEDILVCYGDIIFNESIIEKVIRDNSDISVVVDLNWMRYWAQRSEYFWSDVESFSTDEKGDISSIGQKWTNKSEIQGQYIGVIKFSKSIQTIIHSKLENVLNQKELHNLYMTDFLQMLVDEGYPLRPVYIESGWLEFDQPSDLDLKFLKFLNA
jgi:choline kinase